jgi:hypothetical protein
MFRSDGFISVVTRGLDPRVHLFRKKRHRGQGIDGWHNAHPRCPRALRRGAWAKLRDAVRIVIAVPGNFAHPTGPPISRFFL